MPLGTAAILSVSVLVSAPVSVSVNAYLKHRYKSFQRDALLYEIEAIGYG